MNAHILQSETLLFLSEWLATVHKIRPHIYWKPRFAPDSTLGCMAHVAGPNAGVEIATFQCARVVWEKRNFIEKNS